MLGTSSRHQKYTHKLTGTLQYEKLNSRFFGPLKRAIEAFNLPIEREVNEEEFLSYIYNNFPYFYSDIEFVRFFCFFSREAKMHLRLAVVSVAPILKTRNDLFLIRNDITKETGWYPLVQGSYTNPHSMPYHRLIRKARYKRERLLFKPIGELLGLNPISSLQNNGNGFVLTGSKGTILLDIGFVCPIDELPNINNIFISHMHKDHCGGVWSLTRKLNAPIILSETTLVSLCIDKSIPEELKENVVRYSYPCRGDERINYMDGSHLSVFPVNHSPGSIGLKIIDRNKNMFAYLGDICLKNGFNDNIDWFKELIKGDYSKKAIMFDAAVAGFNNALQYFSDPPKEILQQISEESLQRNIIFVCEKSEVMIYSYLQIFQNTNYYKHNLCKIINIAVSFRLYELIRSLWKPIMYRATLAFDPVVKCLLKNNSQSSFFETHRLYPLTNELIEQNINNEPMIYFIEKNEIKTMSLQGGFRGAIVYLVGEIANENNPIPGIEKIARSVHRIISPDWWFHSSPEDLVEIIKYLTLSNVTTILFHESEDKIKLFLKQYKINCKDIKICSQKPIFFNKK